MKKIFLFLSILTVLTVFTVQGQPYTRIVSLAPSFTQSLYYLEAQDNLVGCTSYCEAAKGDNKEIVSSAVKANVEKIISLKPDLVLASGLTNPKDTELLKKVGIKVEVIYSPKSFQEICDQFIRIGELVGKTEKANALVGESKRTIQEIVEKNKHNTNRKMFFQIGANPLFTVIPNTFMNDYMTLLGIENIAGDLTQGTVTREFVIANNPDYIFIATMGIVGEEELKTWNRYSSLKATRKKQIYIIDSDIACQPTPVTFVQTIVLMNQLMEEPKTKNQEPRQ
ncbi:helical backbone metal receptor [Proteiniphilum sp.]|uniref:ABC transporter substrate-binding protein n=1 Tax=Proteiniphilum sp. TaxID=1926877 RepID=UPI003325D5EE